MGQSFFGSELDPIIILVLYVAYLAFVMLKGLKPRKPSLFNFVIVPALMVYSVIHLYDGTPSTMGLVELSIVLVFAVGKGTYLGFEKKIEKVDSYWVYFHDWKYIAKWLTLFTIKIAFSTAFSILFQTTIPIWHTILYFASYYIARTVTLIARQPEFLAALKRK